jgi:hypothetical protein
VRPEIVKEKCERGAEGRKKIEGDEEGREEKNKIKLIIHLC